MAFALCDSALIPVGYDSNWAPDADYEPAGVHAMVLEEGMGMLVLASESSNFTRLSTARLGGADGQAH
jgi:hypothetical protein